MVSEIYAGYKGFSAIIDLSKKFMETRDAAARNPIIVEFTSKLMEAQQHEAVLIARIDELEKQLMEFENWETEKERYVLHDLGERAFVYRYKDDMEPSEPPHDICATCYQDRKKSILQKEEWFPGRSEVLVCHCCGSVIYEVGGAQPEHESLRPKVNRRT